MLWLENLRKEMYFPWEGSWVKEDPQASWQACPDAEPILWVLGKRLAVDRDSLTRLCLSYLVRHASRLDMATQAYKLLQTYRPEVAPILAVMQQMERLLPLNPSPGDEGFDEWAFEMAYLTLCRVWHGDQSQAFALGYYIPKLIAVGDPYREADVRLQIANDLTHGFAYRERFTK